MTCPSPSLSDIIPCNTSLRLLHSGHSGLFAVLELTRHTPAPGPLHLLFCLQYSLQISMWPLLHHFLTFSHLVTFLVMLSLVTQFLTTTCHSATLGTPLTLSLTEISLGLNHPGCQLSELG